MTDDLVPVAAFGSPAEAHVVRERLAAEGIDAHVVGENAIGTGETFGSPGIELRVHERDAERALAVLEELGLDRVEDEAVEAGPRRRTEEIVTVASYDSPVEARLALAKLTEANIRATLADEELVAMDWAMSNAVGGIKLQVLRSDLLAAERALADRPDDAEPPAARRSAAPPEAIAPEPTQAIRDRPTPALPADEPPANAREEAVVRASRAALFGLLLWPLQVYVLSLLLDVSQSEEPLRPEYRWRVVFALVLAVPITGVMVLLALLLARVV